MPQQTSAEIIQFPNRQATGPAYSNRAASNQADSNQQKRLERALANLDAAMTEQRKAMAAWRSALDDLKASTHSLGDGLRRYGGVLDGLGADVSEVRARSDGLSEWTEGTIARNAEAPPRDIR